VFTQRYKGYSVHGKFFFSELDPRLNVENLLLQAYILVNKVGFTYSEVKKMTRFEVNKFLDFYKDEVKRMNEASRN